MTPQHSPRPRCRAAYTLVEMLIVVSIMIMLVAVTLPVAKKTMEGAQGRECSRELHAYFDLAKSRALQTGRPYGIYFPFPDPPLGHLDPVFTNNAQYANYWPVRQVTQVFMAEIPPYYSGSTTNAVGKVVGTGTSAVLQVWDNSAGQPNGWSITPNNEAQFLASLLFNGEQFLVRFAGKGEWYIFTNVNGNFRYDRPLYQNVSQFIVPQGYGNPQAYGVPFQIARSPQPVGTPLELPRGTCIDLTYSGVGNSYRQFPIPPNVNSRITGLTVLFAPGGAIDSMFIDTVNAKRIPLVDPIGSLFFLIGKIEKVATDGTQIANVAEYANKDNSNLADASSLWLTVSRGTGRVWTSENMPDASKVQLGLVPYLVAARQAAILGDQAHGK